MSAREELFECLMPQYRAQYAPGEEESVNNLLDDFASAERADERRKVRVATLREAADVAKDLASEFDGFHGYDEAYGARRVYGKLRRMADEGETP